MLGEHLAELGVRGRLVRRDDPHPRRHRARLVALLEVLLAERHEVAEILGFELGEPLERGDRQVVLTEAGIEVRDRGEHARVAGEPALESGQCLERLLFLAAPPVALGELELEPGLARGRADHDLVLRERFVVAARVLEQRDQPALGLELVRGLRDRLLERGDRLVLRAGLLVELAERVPFEVAADPFGPLLLVVREQRR